MDREWAEGAFALLMCCSLVCFENLTKVGNKLYIQLILALVILQNRPYTCYGYSSFLVGLVETSWNRLLRSAR